MEINLPFVGSRFVRNDSRNRYGNATMDMGTLELPFVIHSGRTDGLGFLKFRNESALIFQGLGAAELQANPIVLRGGVKVIRRSDEFFGDERGVGESPVLLEGRRKVCVTGLDRSF